MIVVGVILPVENNILPIVPHIEIDKKAHFFTLFAKNTEVLFLLVVKTAETQLLSKKEVD